MSFFIRQLFRLFAMLLLLMTIAVHSAGQVKNGIDSRRGDHIDSLKSLLQTDQNDTVRARIFSQLASNLRYSNTSEALSYGLEALKLSEKISLEDKARDQQILGLIYSRRSDFRNSLFYSLQALRTYESMNSSEGIAYAYNALGIVYEDLKKYDMAERYYLLSLGLIKELKQQKNLNMIYCNLGNLMAARQNMTKCIYYYKKAIEYAGVSDNRGALSVMLYNLGDYYRSMNMTDSAKACFSKVLLEKKNRMATLVDANAYYSLGRIEMEQDRLNAANENLQAAQRMALEGGLTDVLMNVYQALAELRKKEQRFNEAFSYYTLYSGLKDSIYNEASITQINEVQEAYELEKRDKEIQLLSKDKEIAETRIKTARNLYLLIFTFVSCIVIVLIRNIILKQRVQHRILNEKNALIENDLIKLLNENTEARFEVLKSKTNPHFLFNSLASLSAIVKDDNKASEFLEQFIDLYRSVLETNTQKLITLKEELSVVNNYLYLENVRFEDNVSTSIDIPEETLRMQIPPFALQIIVENAFKHNIITDKKKLFIRIYESDNNIVVVNNLQKKLSVAASTHIGQKNIIERYQLLTDQKPGFEETEQEYIVTLPLLKMYKNELTV